MVRQVDRYCKADSLVTTGTTREDRGIDSDQVAFVIHQRTAGVAGVDGRVGLDEVFDFFDTQVAAAHGADDTHGYGLADAERVADGERDVSHLHLGGIAESYIREVGPINLQQ